MSRVLRAVRAGALASALVAAAACGTGAEIRADVHGALPPRCAGYQLQAEPEPAPASAPRPINVPLAELYPNVTAPTSRLDLRRVDLLATVRQARAFTPRARFELPSSGVVVVVHSDGEVAADVAAVDELMHAHMRLYRRHTDPVLRARMRCYAETVIGDRAFAGAVVNLYVPADPSACLRDLRLVSRPAGADWAEVCDFGGATPPTRMAGFLGELRHRQSHVLVAPGIARWSNARPDARLAEVLRHESDHLWDWAMGQHVDVFPNERRAQLGDDIVGNEYRNRSAALPNPFLYGG